MHVVVLIRRQFNDVHVRIVRSAMLSGFDGQPLFMVAIRRSDPRKTDFREDIVRFKRFMIGLFTIRRFELKEYYEGDQG